MSEDKSKGRLHNTTLAQFEVGNDYFFSPTLPAATRIFGKQNQKAMYRNSNQHHDRNNLATYLHSTIGEPTLSASTNGEEEAQWFPEERTSKSSSSGTEDDTPDERFLSSAYETHTLPATSSGSSDRLDNKIDSLISIKIHLNTSQLLKRGSEHLNDRSSEQGQETSMGWSQKVRKILDD